jgi:hypothetical protein
MPSLDSTSSLARIPLTLCLQWLSDEHLMTRLVSRLSPAYSPDMHVVVAELIKGIISMSAPSLQLAFPRVFRPVSPPIDLPGNWLVGKMLKFSWIIFYMTSKTYHFPLLATAPPGTTNSAARLHRPRRTMILLRHPSSTRYVWLSSSFGRTTRTISNHIFSTPCEIASSMSNNSFLLVIPRKAGWRWKGP